MISVATRMRRSDPVHEIELPEFDARARAELTALVGAPVTIEVAPRRPVGSHRRLWIVTAGVAALVIALSIAAIGLSRPHPLPAATATSASSGHTAEPVFFEAAPVTRLAYERAIERLALERDFPMSLDRVIQEAIHASPQLRVDAQSGSSGDGGYQAVGPHRFDIGSDSDDLSPHGGNGTGADAIDVYAMRCAGSGSYSWRVLGHTVGSTRTRMLASAHGMCGPGLTAARFITRGNAVATVLEVDVPRGRSFGIADIGYADFGSPILDSAYPTD